jgi:DNA primase
VIREIHERVDLASFVGQYVTLHKRGNDMVGLCPFHSEKTPSFHVHPDRGFFKCFGCGAGGDVITFAQKIENLAFGDAVRVLAGKAGVEIEPESPRAARARSEREAIYEANRVAAAFFARMLRHESAAAARAYCAQRGLDEATIERFGIGYAPDSWDALVRELQRHGINLALAAKAGLVKSGQRGYYDFYRDRLIIPTITPTGETIAFGGRAIGDGEPKYLNTAASPVYVKGQHLFALNLARRAASAEGALIVVEGYLDCIALHQAGFENSVASLGTSFTAEQAAALRRYAHNVYLCFDGDSAGDAAATKAVGIASKAIEHTGSAVRVVRLPAGQDPDSFVRSNGAAAFHELLERAKPALEYRIDVELDRLHTGFDSPATLAPRAEALIREMAPRQEWDRWRVYVANRLQVNPDDLRNSRFFANSANFAPRGQTVRAHSRHTPARPEFLSFERDVLAILLEEPALAAEYGVRIGADRFRNETYRRIYERIVNAPEALRETADIFGLFAEDQAALDLLAGLGRGDRSSTARFGDSDERRAHLERVVERLQLDTDRRRYQELSRRVDEYLAAGRTVPDALRAEFEELVAKLKRS